MEFEPTERQAYWRDRVRQFIENHVRPRNAEYEAQDKAGERWKVLPVVEEEKARAKAQGIWNLFMPPQSGRAHVDDSFEFEGPGLNNAPRFSMNLGASYETDPVLFDGPLTLRVDVSYRTRVYFREFNAREDSQDPYAIVNASVTWRSPDENYSVRVFGTNLTGQEYYAAMNASSNFGARYASWGMPRQVGIEVRRDF